MNPPDKKLQKRWTRFLVRSVLCAGLIYGGVIVFFASMQRSMIYVARKGAVSLTDGMNHPAQLEEIVVRADDGVDLHGWYAKAAQEESSGQRKLVILFPGNAGNRSNRASILKDFQECGCDSLICDYRGYAENAGIPSESAFALDAQSIFRYAVEKLGYQPDRIVLCGESLGGGVATRLAWELCRAKTPPAGLILRTTFTSLSEVASRFYPWLPVRTLLVDRYPSLERLPEITCPIFVIHGTQDEIIPFSQGEELFRAAPSQSVSGVPKTFLELTGTGHNDVQLTAADTVHEGHQRFLNSIFEKVSQSTAQNGAGE